MAKNHQIPVSTYINFFFHERDRNFLLRTAVTLKFKMLVLDVFDDIT